MNKVMQSPRAAVPPQLTLVVGVVFRLVHLGIYCVEGPDAMFQETFNKICCDDLAVDIEREWLQEGDLVVSLCRVEKAFEVLGKAGFRSADAVVTMQRYFGIEHAKARHYVSSRNLASLYREQVVGRSRGGEKRTVNLADFVDDDP
ncbi:MULTISPECIES: hypothetical protein [unclassified Paraburkholderia]|uniref:hypothetical protein n=2 Tax=Paraburkholderia TaxID=1822464 RepID=UPI0034CF0239